MTDPAVGVEVPLSAPPTPAPQQRPEVLVGAAFAGGVLLALVLKRAGRVS